MASINVAIIGCGRVAGNHVSAIKKLSNIKLVAVCDLVQERAKALIGSENIPIYRNYYEMLVEHPEVDVVAIVTPSGMHYEHSMDVIQNFRKSVLVEKPLVLRLSQGATLRQAALKNEVKVFPVFQYRFNKAVERVKRAVLNNELGKVFMATIRLRWCRPQKYYDRDPWRGTFSLDGGACTNQGIHHIDLLRYLVGEIKRVNSKMSTFGADIEVEDTVMATLEFEKGPMGILEVTTAARPVDYESSISIIGTKGLAVIGGSSTGKLVQFSPDPKEEGLNSEEFPNPYGFGHREIYQGVYNSLVKGEKPAVEFEDAMRTLMLLHSLYVSDEIKDWVVVDSGRESARLGQPNEELANIYRSPKPDGLLSPLKNTDREKRITA